jgi:hypothetical protein
MYLIVNVIAIAVILLIRFVIRPAVRSAREFLGTAFCTDCGEPVSA